MARAAIIPQSPPKKATRGRPKATTATSTTAATKAKARTTKAVASTTTTDTRKRGGRTTTTATSRTKEQSDVGSDEETDDEIGVINTKSRGRPATSKGKTSSTTSKKTTGKGTKTAATATETDSEGDEDELAETDAPKRKPGRPRKDTAAAAKTETAPKSRGRPKKTAVPTSSATEEKPTTRKQTRTQTNFTSSVDEQPKQIVVATGSSLIRSNILRGPAKPKKVTFQDVSDSEEEEIEIPANFAAGRKKAATASARQAGLAAKPVRKPATTSGRGRKATAAAAQNAPQPLSPKKDKQVAKTISSYASSDGEDDELSGAKTPIKLIVQSPVRRNPDNTTGLSSPVRRINFTSSQPPKSVDENGEPTVPIAKAFKFSDSLFMSSPAKRPPPSPFNYTIKETPKRCGLVIKDQSKAITQPDFTPKMNSPLKSSPKKGNLSASFFQSPVKSSTPFSARTCLLQSPAKRVASPFKVSTTPTRAPKAEAGKAEEDDDLDVGDIQTEESPLRAHQLMRNETDTQPETDEVGEKPAAETDAESVKEDEPLPDANALRMEEAIDTSDAENYGKTDGEMAEASDVEAGSISEHYGMPMHQYMGATHDEDDPTAEPEAPETPLAETELSLDDNDLNMEQDMKVNDAEMDQDIEASNSADVFKPALENDASIADMVPAIEDNEAQLDQEMEASDVEDDAELEPEVENVSPELPPVIEGNDADMRQGIEVNDAEMDQRMEESHAECEVGPEPKGDDDFHHLHQEAALAEEEYETDKDADMYSDDENIAEEIIEAPVEHSFTGLEDVFTEAPTTYRAHDADVEIEEPSESPSRHTQPPLEESEGEVEDYDEQESYSDGVRFDDDEATLVAIDENEVYIRTPRRASAYATYETRRRLSSVRRRRSIPPAAPSPPPAAARRSFANEVRQHQEVCTGLESPNYAPEENFEADGHRDDYPQDEVARPTAPTPPETQTPNRENLTEDQQPSLDIDNSLGFTPLAEQMSQWKASSPEKSQPRRSTRRGVFSLAGGLRNSAETPQKSLGGRRESLLVDISIQGTPKSEVLPAEVQEDEEESVMIEGNTSPSYQLSQRLGDDVFTDAGPEITITNETEEIYRDENGPVAEEEGVDENNESSFEYDEAEENKENENIPLPAPATPIRRNQPQMQTFHTVSKVPLKPEGQVSPLKPSRKRTRSLSITSPVRSSPRLRKFDLAQNQPAPSVSPRKSPIRRESTAKREKQVDENDNKAHEAHGSIKPSSTANAPAKSPRRNISPDQQVLRGAVVYVDVHTTEGEDASGIFVELLQQMGARCIKHWSWSPRSSLSPVDGADPKDGKIGITHVVFKDGGVRTLEKVRQACGLVKCVGVGWVLDCERENQWLDEAHYAVDSTIIPRGGAKRRKSMEPRALSNVNGTLVKVESSMTSASGRRSGANWGAVEDFKRHTPPLATPETVDKSTDGASDSADDYFKVPQTPGSTYKFDMDSIGMSPATPFYLGQQSKLVQQTCPPKQTRQGLFSARPGIDDQSSTQLRFKLEAARRKSLAFKPKTGSPLAQ